jgi:hypothetical protein
LWTLVTGWRRPDCPIDAAPDAATDRVVEDQDPAGAGHFGDKTLGFGIVDAAQFVLVIKVPHRAFVLEEGQAFAVERQLRCDRAGVVDRHAVRLGDAGRARHARRRVVGEVHRLLRHRREVVQDALDMWEAIDQVTRERHGSFLSVRVRSMGVPTLCSCYRAGLVGGRSRD